MTNPSAEEFHLGLLFLGKNSAADDFVGQTFIIRLPTSIAVLTSFPVSDPDGVRIIRKEARIQTAATGFVALSAQRLERIGGR